MENEVAEGQAAAGQPDELLGLSQTINQHMQRAKTSSADWRVMARECYDFVAGRQWSDEDEAILNAQRRPPVTFNRISRTINAVIGLEVANRQEVRYIPRGNEDTGYNTMMTDAARWARDLCNAEDEETEAFGDMNTCGMGFTETSMDYETDPDGIVNIERCDPMEMYWDPNATKKNLRDARWLARVRRMSRNEVLANWPKYGEMGGGGGTTEEYLDNEDQPHDASPPWYDNTKPAKRSDVTDIEVIHYQWFEKEKFVRVKSGDKMIEFTPERFARVKERIDLSGLKYVEQKRRVYYRAIKIGNVVYSKNRLGVQEGGFTLKAMTGMRDRNSRSWFGLVSIMMDPQRWANKWLSQIMHILNSNAKGGILYETGAFSNPMKAERDWAKPDAMLELEAGGLEKIKERGMAEFPTGLHELMNYAVESISDTPGISQELMGLVGKEQAGVLESMRKQAGVTMLSVMFDALRLYRKEHGVTLAAFIREYVSDGRLIRVVGPDGAKYVPLARDVMNLRYDTVIDEAPTSHNQKERVMHILLSLVPKMMENGMPPPPPEVLEYLPIPESLSEKWLAKARPDPQKQQKAEQDKEEERQVLLAERRSKAAEQMAKAKETEAKAAETIRNLQSPPDNPMNEAMIERETEQMKAQIRAATDIEVAKIKAAAQAQVEAMKLRAEMPNDNITKALEGIVNNTEAQMSDIRDTLKAVTDAVAESQREVAKLQQPKQKAVRLVTDENGEIVGAQVIESAPRLVGGSATPDGVTIQ